MTTATAMWEQTIPLATETVRVEALRGSYHIILMIEESWRDICRSGKACAPYFSPAWIHAYCEAFEPDATLVLMTVWQGESLLGVLPLIEESAMFCGFGVRRLRSASNVHSCRYDIIAREGYERMVAAALYAFLSEQKDWDVIQLLDVPEGAIFEQVLSRAEEDGFPTGKWFSFNTPIVRLTGKPTRELDTYLNPKELNQQQKYKKKEKKLRALGEITLKRYTDLDSGVLERFFDLEANGWKGREGTAIKLHHPTRRFYTAIAQQAAVDGHLSFYELFYRGRTLSINFGLEMNGVHGVPKTTYDETLREYSPGHIMFRAVLEDCLERGVALFDFLGPTAEWKERFAFEFLKHSNCYIFRRGPLGEVLHSLKFGWAQQLRALKHRLEQRR